jgi:hypothetical protein
MILKSMCCSSCGIASKFARMLMKQTAAGF